MGASGEMVPEQVCKHGSTRSGKRGCGRKGAEMRCMDLCGNKTSSPGCDVSDIGDEIDVLKGVALHVR